MLSAVIHSSLDYPAYSVGTKTGTSEVTPSRSSRTKEGSLSILQRLRRIWTELSRDVLNPARVPL